MRDKRRKKRGVPWTGILAAGVVILAVCVVIMGWLVFHENKDPGAAQSGMETSSVQTEILEGKTEEDTTKETGTEDSEAAGTGMTGAESETAEAVESGAEETDFSEEETDLEAMTETELLVEVETETEAEKLVVAIDPGHQGNWVDMSALEPSAPGSSEMKAKATTGTQGRFSGKKEFELNMEISLLLRDELESRGYEVILTREDNDTAISNSERALKAYEEGGDIYVRIHANGSDDSSVDGALAMVPSSSNPYVGYLAEDSYLLADCILSAYCQKASFDSLGIQYYDNMTGINWSKLPVMILEMGFMTNEYDDLRMADTQVQPLMAEGIADGIDAYFEQKGMKTKEVSAEAQAKMNTALEVLEEEYIYPSQDKGETWAVSFLDVGSGAQGDISGDTPMKSASVIKAFILAAIYDRVCYPSSAERQLYIQETYDGELKQLLTDMITVSDNDAANTLLERLGGGDAAAGMAVVNQFCEENGYTGTSIGRKFLESNPSGDNYTTANDCRNLLASIYSGTCVCQEASAKMYEYFKNQTRVGKIPAGLAGTGASVANKTGELAGEYGDYVENDIAVIETGDSAYVLCILSGSLQDNGTAITQIGSMARSVYDLWQTP